MKSREAFSRFPHPEQEKQIMGVWDRFLQSGELPSDAVRNVIERSWWRCHGAGVNPALTHAPDPLSEESLKALQQRDRELIEASVPIMAQARDLLSESGTIMILTDPSGVILETEGDSATLEAALDVRLTAGANWNELCAGTNAIGTALSVGEPVQVHGAEHFCAGIKPWTCSATPVRDPADGELLGVLDVSGLRSAFSRQSLALVMAAAGRIEGRLTAGEMELRHRLLEWGLGHLSKVAAGGLLFFDRKGRLIKMHARAGASLAAMSLKLGLKTDTRVDAFSTETPPDGGQPELPEWLRAEWVEPVVEGSDRLGTIVVLPEPSTGGGQRARRSAPVPSGSDVEVDSSSFDHIIGRSDAMGQAVEKARQLAQVDAPVLLLGETGVGKEVFARAIHEGGRRKNGPFVALNCGGLPRDILASELFGYVEGAFTGARRAGMMGKIEAANGGTLFLDEIGEMALDLQPYLLRVLEGGVVYPLGDNKPRTVNFRLLAATNRDLRAEVAARSFRMDLFYRVSVMSVRIPPLREHHEDIPALVEHFSRDVARRHGVPVKRFESAVLDAFRQYAWPGNVRELLNVVEGTLLMAAGDAVTLDDLPPEIAPSIASTKTDLAGAVRAAAPTNLEAVECDTISATMATYRGNLSRVARELGISKSTLYLKIKKHRLDELLSAVRLGGR